MVVMGKQEAAVPSEHSMYEAPSLKSNSNHHVVTMNNRSTIWFILLSITISFWLGYYSKSIPVVSNIVWGESNCNDDDNNNNNNNKNIRDLSSPEFNDSFNHNNRQQGEPSPPTILDIRSTYLNIDDIDFDQRKQSILNTSVPKPKQHEHQKIFNVEYYESLVHPAMFTHDNPERICIVIGSDNDSDDEDEHVSSNIGGSNSIINRQQQHVISIVTEVLKHKTVKELYIVGATTTSSRRIDYLVENDSSRIIKVINQQPMEWFLENFELTPSEDDNEEDDEGDVEEDEILFDVIILDLL